MHTGGRDRDVLPDSSLDGGSGRAPPYLTRCPCAGDVDSVDNVDKPLWAVSKNCCKAKRCTGPYTFGSLYWGKGKQDRVALVGRITITLLSLWIP